MTHEEMIERIKARARHEDDPLADAYSMVIENIVGNGDEWDIVSIARAIDEERCFRQYNAVLLGSLAILVKWENTHSDSPPDEPMTVEDYRPREWSHIDGTMDKGSEGDVHIVRAYPGDEGGARMLIVVTSPDHTIDSVTLHFDGAVCVIYDHGEFVYN